MNNLTWILSCLNCTYAHMHIHIQIHINPYCALHYVSWSQATFISIECLFTNDKMRRRATTCDVGQYNQSSIQWIPQYNWHNSDCVTITCSCEFGKPACESLWACGMLGITHGMNHLCTSRQCAIINPSLQEQGCPCLKPMGIWESRKQLIYLH